MPDLIDSFRGEYRFLSNFYPVVVFYDGYNYPTVEHAYQASKAETVEAQLAVGLAESPGQAKLLGKLIKVRPGWHLVKVSIMRSLVNQKFSSMNPELRQRLLDTGMSRLIERNTWFDMYWGVYEGRGQNLLGKILMATRAEIRRSS